MGSTKRLSVTAYLLIALSFSGCGVQFGKYASSGSYYDIIKPDFGIISIDRGTTAFTSSNKNRNLMAVILWCPGVETRPPTGSSQTNGVFLTERRFWWTTNAGRIDFSYTWNRLTDKVTIVGKRFDRAMGNGFVVGCDSTKQWSVRQVCEIPSEESARGVLQSIQHKLPKDDFVARLSVFFEVENGETGIGE